MSNTVHVRGTVSCFDNTVLEKRQFCSKIADRRRAATSSSSSTTTTHQRKQERVITQHNDNLLKQQY